jgi:hypothetical protein
MLIRGSEEFNNAVCKFQNDPFYHTIVNMFISVLREEKVTLGDIESALGLAEFQVEMHKNQTLIEKYNKQFGEKKI